MVTDKTQVFFTDLAFHKIQPGTFREKLARLERKEFDTQLIQVFIGSDDVKRLLEEVPFIRIIGRYPHIGFICVETNPSSLAALVENPLVKTVWDNAPTRAGGCAFPRSNPGATALAARPHR